MQFLQLQLASPPTEDSPLTEERQYLTTINIAEQHVTIMYNTNDTNNNSGHNYVSSNANASVESKNGLIKANRNHHHQFGSGGAGPFLHHHASVSVPKKSGGRSKKTRRRVPTAAQRKAANIRERRSERKVWIKNLLVLDS